MFDENLVAIKLGKVQVLIDKPFYIGFCAFDVSKTCVCDLYYRFMQEKLENDCKILYTDTDSLIYEDLMSIRAREE